MMLILNLLMLLMIGITKSQDKIEKRQATFPYWTNNGQLSNFHSSSFLYRIFILYNEAWAIATKCFGVCLH